MATTLSFTYLLFFISAIAYAEAGWVGVNWGRIADNLPPPSKVVMLLKSKGINRVKIFDVDRTVLTALANSGIKVTVCLPNEIIFATASNQSFADHWIRSNIRKHFPATQIEAIAVGNEVTSDPRNAINSLVQAMRNLHASLAQHKLDSHIKVSSPIALSALQNSYPPSAGSFQPELMEPVMKPMLEFLRQTGSYFMANVYPFFAYASNSKEIALNYALFNKHPGVVDPGTGFKYRSLFLAQLDAVHAAISALNYGDVKVVVTETGWPSRGDDHEIGAGVANAEAYNANLVRRVLTGGGTPARPNDPLRVFLFALFNENRKPGPTTERNFGLFYPNQRSVYNVELKQTEVKSEV